MHTQSHIHTYAHAYTRTHARARARTHTHTHTYLQLENMLAQQRSAPVGAASAARVRSPSLSPPQRTSRPHAPKPLVRVSLDERERERTLRSHFPQKQNVERDPGTQRRRLAQGLPVMPLSEVRPYEHMYTWMYVCACVCACVRVCRCLRTTRLRSARIFSYIHTCCYSPRSAYIYLSIYKHMHFAAV